MFKLKCDDFLVYDESTGTYSMPADQQVRDQTEKNKWKTTGLTLLKDWRLYLMLVPMLVVYLLWRYAPMTELLAAFKDGSDVTANGVVANQPFYGFNNFINLFTGGADTSGKFWPAFRNTFAIAFYNLLFGFPMPIILALFFNEVRSNVTRSVIQVLVYLPKFLSTVIVTSIALLLLNAVGGKPGALASLLSNFAPNSEVFQTAIEKGLFYSSRYFRSLFVITELWEHAGYDSIVFFAAVIAVSPTSYEAAQIDGAGKMAQMRYVVIPSILSTVVIMLIMKIGGLLSVGMEKVYLLLSTGNKANAEIVSTLANDWGNSTFTTSLGVAAEMTNNLIGMILVLGANTVAKRAANVSLY